MEESEGLAYDDPCSSSDATVIGVDSPPSLNCPNMMNLQIPRFEGFGPSLAGVAHGANAAAGARSHCPSIRCGHSCGVSAPDRAG